MFFLVLAFLQSTPLHEKPQFEMIAANNDAVTVFASETKRDSTNGTVSAWIRVDHTRNKSTLLRSSLWRYTFDCKGNESVTANTDYKPDGSVAAEWNGYMSAAIRPGTLSAELEKTLCAK